MDIESVRFAVRERYDYNPETGEFTQKKPRTKVGKVVETDNLYVGTCGPTKTITRDAAVWLMHTGELPPKGSPAVYRNGDSSDKRFENIYYVDSSKSWNSNDELLALLQGLFDYDPETGVFTSKRTGEAAGCVNDKGYVFLSVVGKLVLAHRAAWLMTHGELPEMLDHINRDRADNRIANLRPATAAENIWNSQPRPNKTGYAGVTPKGARFMAKIRVDGRTVNLGVFDTPVEAHAAYVKAAKERYGEFYPRH